MQTAAGVREKFRFGEMIILQKMELQSESYIYVVDLAKAHVKALQKVNLKNVLTRW